ncbi:MAG: rod shape-determining protein MreD [Lysobacteraceae bacterium]
MSRSDAGLHWLPITLLLALLLGLVPLPDVVLAARPYWLGLVLIYWLLETPERAGMGLAFAVGLIGDLAFGSLIGEQALRLVVIAFIVQRFRARMRFFPLGQQSLAVFALLTNDRVIALIARMQLGQGLPHWSFWLSPVLALLIWPWLVVLLDTLRLRARNA